MFQTSLNSVSNKQTLRIHKTGNMFTIYWRNLRNLKYQEMKKHLTR